MRLITVSAFALLLAACGQGTAPSATETTTPPAATEAAAPAAPAPAAAPDAPTPEEVAAVVTTLPAPYNQGDYDAGRRVFATCRSCHTIEAGGPNRVGPNLHGLFGRHVGSKEGFTYSPALQAADFVWSEEQLDHWLQNPREFLPGNRMAFVGVRDETQRRDLITFLHVESARGE